MQGLVQWIYSLFLDVMAYCANALLGIMSTDLQFFEDTVPIVPALYGIFVAVGWGLLIGNCAFQCVKAMFAGFGFETESPAILLLRTFLFGFLLTFSMDICEIGLSISKNVIDLVGVPTTLTISMPTISMFGNVGSSWLLVIIVGFVLGFQLIKFFFEIAERYAVVAVLTLLCPVGLAFGGSKSTKDICVGFIRTYASMLVMMVMNVLFLKLVLSALGTMPTGALILPWCLLVVGITKTARKADQLVSKIGLSPAITGDPLGAGRGLMVMAMAARTVMSVSGKGGTSRIGSGSGKTGAKGGSTGARMGSSVNNSAKSFGGNSASNVRNTAGGTQVQGSSTGASHAGKTNATPQNIGGSNIHAAPGSVNMGGSHISSNSGGSKVGGNHVSSGAAFTTSSGTTSNAQRNTHGSVVGGSRNITNSPSASSVRFGANAINGGGQAVNSYSGRSQFSSSGKAQVNTNRFGSQPVAGKPGSSLASASTGTGGTGAGKNHGINAAVPQHNTAKTQGTQPGTSAHAPGVTGNHSAKTGDSNAGGGRYSVAMQQTQKGAPKQAQRNHAQTAVHNAQKSRFGGAQSMGTVRRNTNPVGMGGKIAMPNVGMVRATPGSTKSSAHADMVEKTDTLEEIIQTAGPAAVPKDGEDHG